MVEHGVNPEVISYDDSLWFVLQTITTVGYGDIVPVTGIRKAYGCNFNVQCIYYSQV